MSIYPHILCFHQMRQQCVSSGPKPWGRCSPDNIIMTRGEGFCVNYDSVSFSMAGKMLWDGLYMIYDKSFSVVIIHNLIVSWPSTMSSMCDGKFVVSMVLHTLIKIFKNIVTQFHEIKQDCCPDYQPKSGLQIKVIVNTKCS